jgi:hypothetical protein
VFDNGEGTALAFVTAAGVVSMQLPEVLASDMGDGVFRLIRHRRLARLRRHHVGT